jgi:hypothetical protein
MTTATLPRTYTGRAYLWLGLVVAVLGIAGYVVQVSLPLLKTPWYLPITGMLGLVFVLIALWRQRTIWRFLALLLVGLLVAAELFMLLGARLAPYTGPIAVGQPFPAFATQKADGSPFTQQDLQGDKSQVMVFFRGRW